MVTSPKPDMLPTPTLEESLENMFSIVDTVSDAINSLLIPQLESDIFTNTSKTLS